MRRWDGWGSLQKVARSELDNGRVQSLSLSLISLFFCLVHRASIGMSILASMADTNVVICSFTITPAFSNFSTTQKEAKMVLSFDFLNV